MSAVLIPTHRANPWRGALLALALVLALLGGLYADTVAAMVGIWNRSETFAHAFLVPPIALWLIWRQRAVLAQITPRPAPWVLLLLAAFAGMWLLADLVLVNAAAQFAWVAMLVLAVPAVLGLQVAMAILFPLMFLFFAVPMGEFMTDPMMKWTADFTVTALRASGIPVYREGLQFVIPSGNWSVVEACSGVRYLIASFMVGTLFAYLNYRSWKRRVLFMAVSILVPIVANWLRAYMIVMLGHHSGNTIAVGADHLVYGWVFFGIVVMIMFMIGARWSEPDPPVAVMQHVGNAAIVPLSSMLAIGLATVAVLLLPHGAMWLLNKSEAASLPAQLVLPAAPSAAWRVAEPSSSFRPVFAGPSVQLRKSYVGAAGEVGLYLAYYRGQTENSKLVSSVNMLVASTDKERNQVSASVTSVVIESGQTVHWRTAQILGAPSASGRRERLTAWRVYWIDGRWVAGDAQAKLAGAVSRLMGRGDDGAVLVLWTDKPSDEEARTVLENFVRDHLRVFGSALAQTRDGR